MAGGVAMPAGLLQLITEGILYPEPGDPHYMRCAECGLPVALVWNHPPGIREGETIPAAEWGKDVSVVCPCCSYQHCRHKRVEGEEERIEAVSEALETFEYRIRADFVTFVVVSRKTPEEYRAGGDERMYQYMRAQKVVAMIRARRRRGQRDYLFYEVQDERGLWRRAAEKL